MKVCEKHDFVVIYDTKNTTVCPVCIIEEQIMEVEELVHSCPEINMNNFSADEVEELNNTMTEIWEVLQ